MIMWLFGTKHTHTHTYICIYIYIYLTVVTLVFVFNRFSNSFRWQGWRLVPSGVSFCSRSGSLWQHPWTFASILLAICLPCLSHPLAGSRRGMSYTIFFLLSTLLYHKSCFNKWWVVIWFAMLISMIMDLYDCPFFYGRCGEVDKEYKYAHVHTFHKYQHVWVNHTTASAFLNCMGFIPLRLLLCISR